MLCIFQFLQSQILKNSQNSHLAKFFQKLATLIWVWLGLKHFVIFVSKDDYALVLHHFSTFSDFRVLNFIQRAFREHSTNMYVQIWTNHLNITTFYQITLPKFGDFNESDFTMTNYRVNFKTQNHRVNILFCRIFQSSVEP